jgi:hypothetical protein
MSLRVTSFAIAAAGMLLLVATGVARPQDEDAPPNKRETGELVEELFALGTVAAEDRAREDEIVARLALLPALDAQAEAKWRKDLAKLWASGPTLPKKAGEYRDLAGDRGRYFIAGRTRGAKGLLLGMHGGGAGSGDAGSSHATYRGPAEELDWVAIFPEVLEKTEHGWTDAGTEEWVLDLVERARRTFDVPADRVYFSGHSMGGYGTWLLGGHHADQVAAIAPSAGAPTPIMNLEGEYIDVIEGVVPNLRNVPVRVYQSSDDVQVPPAANDIAVERLRAARERWGGYDFEYWRVDGRGHDHPPGGVRALLDKVAPFRREAHPDHVVWQPTLDWKRSFYWLWWEAPRANAIVEAVLDRENNSVDLVVDGSARGLFVQVSDGVFDLEREIVVTLRGTEVFRGRVEPHLSILATTARTGDPGRTYVARIPLVP